MATVELREYRTTPAVALTQPQRDLLARLVSDLTIQPTPGTTDAYDLTPGSKIGTVRVDDTTFHIHPKIPVERVMFLIAYAADPNNWQTHHVTLGDATTILESIVPPFAHHVRTALRRGLLQGYRSTDDALPAIRGRIRFADHTRRRHGLAPPVEVTYDDFTEDITENRLLKAATSRLLRIRLRIPDNRATLRAFDVALVNVTHVDYHPLRIPTPHFTRLNDHYRPAIGLAQLIVGSTSLELRHGTSVGTAFLVDMNAVFEDFVYTGLREHLRVSAIDFPQGAHRRSLYLDSDRRVLLKPDLSWWHNKRCVFVGDVKYKRTDTGGTNPDLYQLLAYTTATNLAQGTLIYAAGETDPTTHRIPHGDKRIDVITLDLDQPPNDVLRQLGAIANVISETASTEDVAA